MVAWNLRLKRFMMLGQGEYSGVIVVTGRCKALFVFKLCYLQMFWGHKFCGDVLGQRSVSTFHRLTKSAVRVHIFCPKIWLYLSVRTCETHQ